MVALERFNVVWSPPRLRCLFKGVLTNQSRSFFVKNRMALLISCQSVD
jgi:hypothetical protein